jgi:predicted DNA-binding transcriptional regulator YafY
VYRYIDTFKDAGFVVQNLGGGVYKLGKESRHFKDISQLVHFTDEEAHIVNQLIEALDDTNMLKQNLRRKLTSIYDCTSMAQSIVRGRNAQNVNALLEAMTQRRQVILRDYASSNTGVVRDRVVEPFGFTTNYVQVWCYEVDSGLNKIFKTSRIGSVDILDDTWQHAESHEEGYIDIFRMTGFEQHRVCIRLGMMAHNLLLEEYPLAERDIIQQGDSWLLDTKVCNYRGVGRFVLGLMDDVEVLENEEFKEYLRTKLLEARF